MNITKTLIDTKTINLQANWKNWGQSKELSERMCARGLNLMLIPMVSITCAIDIILGLGAAIGAICTLGLHIKTTLKAYKLLKSSKKIVAAPFALFLKTIDPQLKFEKTNRFSSDWLQPLNDFCNECSLEDNSFFNRHIAARISNALLAVTHLVTFVVEAAIGLLAGSLSILTLAHFDYLNKTAYRGLHAPGVIFDIFLCIIGIINPTAVNKALEMS